MVVIADYQKEDNNLHGYAEKNYLQKNFSSFSSISFALTIKLFNESYISIV